MKETKICFVLFVRFTGFRTVAVNWRCKACGCFSDPFQEGVIEVLYKLQHSDSDQSLQNRLNKTLSQNTVCSEDCVWNCWRFCHCVCVCFMFMRVCKSCIISRAPSLLHAQNITNPKTSQLTMMVPHVPLVCVNLASYQEHFLCCMRRTLPVPKLHS